MGKLHGPTKSLTCLTDSYHTPPRKFKRRSPGLYVQDRVFHPAGLIVRSPLIPDNGLALAIALGGRRLRQAPTFLARLNRPAFREAEGQLEAL